MKFNLWAGYWVSPQHLLGLYFWSESEPPTTSNHINIDVDWGKDLNHQDVFLGETNVVGTPLPQEFSNEEGRSYLKAS